ncbi:M67 family metallopeptidase [Novosphingobium lindaniclasticum]|jgi:proteasome lid subunit RPN8/RPN11|uniref:M67 family metallopeptidase n=1 Tax=Novosphingobium lindaniclasticum TaxID=1329895 RepID=UPI0024093473|nr:M67 family metallopeptidase [Novosphingobium lindaniclasticum]
MNVEVTSDVIARLREESDKADPQECCGILTGREDRIEGAIPAANVAADPARHFEIDPATLLAAHRAARHGGPEVLGYYHSHPVGHPVPSATDCEHSTGDLRVWAIIATGQVAFWRDTGNGFAPVTYHIVGPTASLGQNPNA